MNYRQVGASIVKSIENAACLCLIFGLMGCGSNGPTRISISGKVTRGGQPIPQGSITLTPSPGQKGMAANTSITDGTYRFTSDDGPSPGAYQATIQEVVAKDELMKRESIGGIPATHWERDVKVPEGGSTTIDFAVE